MPGFPVQHCLLSLLKLTSIESVIPSNHLVLCCPLILLPSIFPSIRVFSNESALHITWSKNWRFSFSISPSNEYSVLISLRIEWFDLLGFQGTLKGLLQLQKLKKKVQLLQFKSINTLAVSLFYGPTLISIYDYWINHSFDYTRPLLAR